MMKVLAVGGGGREHEAVEALYRSGSEIYSVMKNANPGIMKRAKKTLLCSEKDLDKVHLDLELYRAYAEGFLGACGDRLTKAERETLPDGARIITLENAVRFLTDYLNGDTYYHIERPEHNLDRTRTQMALTAEMEKNDGIIRKMMSEI